MTVSYHSDLSSQSLNTFVKLLLRWRGSVYKPLYKELLAYLATYAVISAIYRFALGPFGKEQFEKISLACLEYSGHLPITFLLGLYINFLVIRWWDQLKNIPWPDTIANMVNSIITENTDEAKQTRLTVVRYLILSLIIRMRAMGTCLNTRFPSLASLIKEGFINDRELLVLETLKSDYSSHYLPLQWASKLITEWVHKRESTASYFMLPAVIKEINDYGSALRMLLLYGMVPVPLVYTQAVTIAVYTYFLALLLGRQYLNPEQGYTEHQIDMYVPFFTILQYIFYVGWLKVAEAIMNPFGTDDEDFDCIWFVDRHCHIGYLIASQNWDPNDFSTESSTTAVPSANGNAGVLHCTDVTVVINGFDRSAHRNSKRQHTDDHDNLGFEIELAECQQNLRNEKIC